MAYEDGVFATFYDDALKNEHKTKAVGYPVFDDVQMISIQVPNSTDNAPRPVQEVDKQRFPKSWEAYVTGKEPAETGFPLEQWPQFTAAELKVCQANHIKTVEQLAETADSSIHRLGPGAQSMKARAKKFLEEAQGTTALQARIAELEADIAELKAASKPAAKKRKRLQIAETG